MSRLSLLRASDYQRVRWKNDGGWTTEIARDPSAAADDFRWRVSIADIESDGPFSNFHGIDHDLLLLAGNGIELDIDGAHRAIPVAAIRSARTVADWSAELKGSTV